MEEALTISAEIGVKPICEAFDISRSVFYRALMRRDNPIEIPDKRPSPPRALSYEERQTVLDVLHSDRFSDKAPHEVYATLLDDGIYYCSIRTMYRILEGNGEVKERRNQLMHPTYRKPELLATGPNQVWSWDITKLLGPVKWSYFYLYVILDIFSRYVVGWMVAGRGCGPCVKINSGDLCCTEHRVGATHYSCGPGIIHEVQAGCIPPCRSGGNQNSQQASYE
jgi:putative transposase